MTVRSYFVEPPTYPKLINKAGDSVKMADYSLPAFMYKYKRRNPLLMYLEDVIAWAEKEYEQARLFYVMSGNQARLAWILSLTPNYVLARSELVNEIFDLFNNNPEIWQSLDAHEQNFFVDAWKIWDFEKASYEVARREQRARRKKPTAVSLPRYDEVIKSLLVFNRAYGELSPQQLTDAAIAGSI